MLIKEKFIILMLYLKIKNQKLNPKFSNNMNSNNMKLKNFSFIKYKI